MIGIYGIKNIINNKLYIGQSQDINARFSKHKKDLEKGLSTRHLQNDWDEFGKSNFDFFIIEICNEIDLDSKEEYYIKFFKSNNREFGYNIKDGGHRNKHSDESKLLISKSRFGSKLSEETKLKISESKKGKVLTEETKQKISKTLMKRTYEPRAKPKPKKEIICKDISQRNKGIGNGMAKLNLDDCKKIKELLKSFGIKEIAKMLSISEFPIGQIKRGKHWSCF